MDREQVKAELRKQMSTYDYQPLDVQEALIDTRLRELAVDFRQPTAANPQLVVRQRQPIAPAALQLPGKDANEAESRQSLRKAIEVHDEATYDRQDMTRLASEAADRLRQCQ